MKYKKNFRHFYEKERKYHRAVREHGRDILESHNFRKTKKFIQHGNMTVNSHCINVAKYSLAISDRLGMKVDKRKLIRGALLHDYFLYDWHDDEHNKWYRLHGLKHPRIALHNAAREYKLSDKEKDIIRKHMWPLTPIPPMCKEAWIVTAADKWCSLMETLKIHRGHGAQK